MTGHRDDGLDRVWRRSQEWRRRADRLLERAALQMETAGDFYAGEREALPGQTSAESGRPYEQSANALQLRAQAFYALTQELEALIGRERRRQLGLDPHDVPHDDEVSEQGGTVPNDRKDALMDTNTLADRLEGVASLLRLLSGNIAVSWLYVDPTPDGPGDARTIHTVELDGSSAQEVLENLDGLVSHMTSLEHVGAEATPGRVTLEALGHTTEAGDVRGTAVILEPYATPLSQALGLTLSAGDVVRSRTDLTLALVEQLAQDPNMAPQVADPQPPAVDVPPAPDQGGGDVSPSQDPSTTPSPSQPTSGEAGSSTGDSSGLPPGVPVPDSAVTPSGDTAGQQPAPSDSSATPSAPSDSSGSPVVLDPATSETGGGTTTPPASGDAVPDPSAGGVVIVGNQDTQQGTTPDPVPSGPGTASPDPASTASTPPADTGVATGQQPGTQDGAPFNQDGTPVEPTAGTTADVGPADSPASSPDPAGAGLPGQTPVAVSDQPADAVTDPGSDPTAARTQRITELQQELARLQQEGGGQATVTGDTGVTVAANADPVPDGGVNLASGQGGGATDAAPDSGDGSATATSAGTTSTVTPTAPASDTSNPDGF